MNTIALVTAPEGRTEELLNGVQKQMGMIPNLMRALAHSPSALSAYLSQVSALAGGALDRALREKIAVAVAGINHCDYCASAHTVLGRMAGVDEGELACNLKGESADEKTQVALAFVRSIVENRGLLEDGALDRVRKVGFSEGEIVEIIAHTGMNIFTNYFNHIAGTDVDFPRVRTS